jgi:hypothetical protein
MGLEVPEGYQPTNWNFILSTPLPLTFLQPFSITVEITTEDLKRANVTQADLLTILQWSTQEQRWIELDSKYIPETNTIQAILARLESSCYLVLVARKPTS